jgi:N-acyl-D-aspartate/D-glutamate deacylase
MDVIIRGGTVVDGSGAPPRTADVGIAGDRVVEVGRIEGANGARIIDADGLLVTPGFVDIHTHFDGQATWDPVLAPSSLHGVTTVAMGNCGVGFAPARPDRHDWLISLLEGVEDIPGTALTEGMTWGWESFPEYLDVVERTARTIDVAAHVPHAPLRTYVMGDRGADHTQQPDADEIARMAELTETALAAGAIGFATSRTDVHRTSAGDNIGTLHSGEAELLAIAGALARAGTGVIQLISDAYQSNDEDYVTSEANLIAALARTSGRRLSFTVQQPYHAPDRWRDLFGRITAWRSDGLDIKAQVAPRPIGVLLGLEATANPFLFCAGFDEIARLPLAERVAALGDPGRKARILTEHRDMVATLEPGLFRSIVAGFDVTFEMGDPVDYQLDTEMSVGAAARRVGRDPAELLYDLLLQREGRQLLYLPLFNFANGNFDDIHDMITADHALFGLSDAGAHCGAICDASTTTSYLTVWARDRRGAEPLPVESVVHHLTQRTAAHVGWLDRGVLAPGYLADVNLIDFERLGCAPPRIVHDLPAGGRRLTQDATGYVATLKSGTVTFQHGVPTGARPGGLVRGQRQAPGNAR